MSKLLVYLPARNSEKTIIQVLDRIPARTAKIINEVLVVDNKSKDRTVKKIEDYMSKKRPLSKKISLIKNKRDTGYGGSQKIGYSYAVKKGYDYVVMLHSDGQYPPEKIHEIVEKIIAAKSDMVYGSRFMGEPLKGRMSLLRYIGNRGLTFLENQVFNSKFSEFHSGFRIYNVKSLKKIPFKKCTDKYYFDNHLMFLMLSRKMRINEIPIPTHYGKESQSPSFIELAEYTLDILRELVLYKLNRGIYR